MKTFEFSRDKEVIKSIINNADQFLNIVSFQFTDDSFIRNFILNNSPKISIEILTLPEDSYSRVDEREKIIQLYKDLEKAGAKVHKCFWEIGDPSLTTTSQSGDEAEGGGNKWYSMHGKFMFTDKEVLMMTANFTETEEFESYLRIQDPKVVGHFIEKFSYLKLLFIKNNKYPGILYDLVSDDVKEYIDKTYEINKRLNILQYPPKVILDNTSFDGLKITPFDGKARQYLYDFISNAKSFLYLSTERLFDEELIDFLIKRKKTNPIEIKLLTCPPNQIRQNPQKAERMIIDLLSANINIRFYNDIHAKCWISDELIGIGSINLGQMNLGIEKSGGYWRSNTETIYFDNDINIINQAKNSFEQYFNNGHESLISISRTSKHINEAKTIFSLFEIRSTSGAKETVSLIKTTNSIKEQQHLYKIVTLSVKIAQNHNNNIVTKENVLSALILFYLTDRKHEPSELLDKMSPMVQNNTELDSIIQILLRENLIEFEDRYIKIDTAHLI